MANRQRLSEHPFFAGQQILSAEQLHGGLNHIVHKVITDRQTVVTRSAVTASAGFSELKLQSELAALGHTAEVLDCVNDIAVLQYLPGEHPIPGQWSNRQLTHFAKLLSDIHSFKPKSTVKTLKLESYIQQYISGYPFDKAQSKLISAASAQLWELFKRPLSPGLCHHDLNPLNIILHGDRPWLIDFEGIAYSDLYFDLAGFIVEQQLDETASLVFLNHYFTLPEQNKVCDNDKLQLMKIAYCLICWIWYLQHQQSNEQQYARTVWYENKLKALLSLKKN